MNLKGFRKKLVTGTTMSCRPLILGLLLLSLAGAEAEDRYLVCVSNEKSGDVTIMDGAQNTVIATVPVGKRPRGIHASPDGKMVYVALSGSPLSGPRLGGFKADDEPEQAPDHSADGIGVVDLTSRKFLRKIPGGSDPEQFAISPDGRRLYISNEDTSSASVVNITTGKMEATIPLKPEPEGVSLKPGGEFAYVTCETGGEIFVIDTKSNKVLSQFKVGPRPRNVVFSRDGSRAFIPSESTGKVYRVDTTHLQVLGTVSLPPNSRPMGLALAPSGKELYVSTGWAGTVCVIDTATQEVLKTVKVGARPWGIALSPDGRRLYVANGPSNDVSIVDTEHGTEIARVKTGEKPWGVAVALVAEGQPGP